jgi:purine-binding chemotaxis protein CheW
MSETNQAAQLNEEISAMNDLAGKYLTFVLDQEEYGIEILKVREIIGMIEVTPVPQVPHCIKGVINLRGKVIPVADLRLKFGMEEKGYDEETCIIVLDVAGTLMGAIVDTVSEVLDVVGEQIEPTPDFGSRLDTEYILGMGKIGDKVKILLDIDKVLSTDEIHV